MSQFTIEERQNSETVTFERALVLVNPNVDNLDIAPFSNKLHTQK